MNPQKYFKKHRSKLSFETWLLALLCASCLGFGCGFLIALITWFTKLNGLVLGLITAFGVTLIATPVFYLAKFRLTAVKNARRLDSLGLEERLITMIEFEKDDSVIAELQRKDARTQLEKLQSSSIKIHIRASILVPFVITLVLLSSMMTVTVLSQQGFIPGGDELLEDAIEEAQEVYVSVTYDVEDGGYIEGEADQLILQGSNAVPVVAVAEDGYIFVEWDDGRSKPGREDTKITEDVIYVAIFEPIMEGDEDDGEENGIPE